MKAVHLIGICGTGMATLAVLLKQRGFSVQGSDEHVYPPMSDFLLEHGIGVLDGYRTENITKSLDLVVVGNAVSRGNLEVEAVLDNRIRYASFPEVVRNEFLWSRRPVVISGTHGKTTTASMLALILTYAGVDPSFLIGGISPNLSTSGRIGQGNVFVIEGDEYDSAFFDKTAKFLKYLPEVLVINNLEFDHADIYQDLDELRLAFRRLVGLVSSQGLVIVNADDSETQALGRQSTGTVQTFGFGSTATWQASQIEYRAGMTTFDLVLNNEKAMQVAMPVIGAFNVRNALGAMAAANGVGVVPEESAEALRRFRGVKRRLEVRGVVGDVTIYDDFAHHPTAVRETLAAMRSISKSGRVWALFEPRSATSCRRVFQEEFADSLRLADCVIVTQVYRKNILESDRLSELQLVSDLRSVGVDATFAPTIDEVVSIVAESALPGDHVVAMSNGGFGNIHEKLVVALESR